MASKFYRKKEAIMTQNNNKKTINKLYLIGAILLVISVFRYFELSQYLTLSYIKESQQEFHVLYLSNRGLFIAAYMGIYVVVTALSLPGAAVLTLSGSRRSVRLDRRYRCRVLCQYYRCHSCLPCLPFSVAGMGAKYVR